MLTQTQLDAFHRDGFLVVRGLFDAAEIEELRAAAAQVQADAVAGKGEGHSFREVDGERRYFRTDGLWDLHPAFRRATVKPELLAAVGQCVGHPFLPINDSIVVKLPGSGVPIEWHQDPPYYDPATAFAETFAVPNFDVDVYLDVADLETGCLFGIPGHHLVGRTHVERFAEEDLFAHPDAVALEMAPGDVLFHALSAPHGSRANEGRTIRRVFYLHYMAREVLEHCYADWTARPNRGFGEDGIAWARGLVAEADGAAALAAAGVELTEAGFVFAGEPRTPPRHWGSLIAALGPEEIADRRDLKATAAA
ncbi:MAG TPA: phytanoyl-CoA dioxygenase family protein [Gaiellaceae bacterium]|nr:phytanoyl-CoA dioxygenase family protein [Gaiellaceae bacterium]